MQFLYGNHVLKNGLGRITENTPAYTGVVVYSMSGGWVGQRGSGFALGRLRVGETAACKPHCHCHRCPGPSPLTDVPLGFGVTAKSTSECRSTDPNAIVVFHQADCGEYLRAEDKL
jgi:60S ribosome subunit biogenesis protein NIP7